MTSVSLTAGMDALAEKVLCRSVGCSDALIETKGRESGIFFLEGWEKEEGHLLSEADMLWLEKWTSVVPEQVDLCVHDLITERCRAQSDAHAVCAWDGDLTYGELDALSSVLAADLVERGVGPEVFVPLCFEKSRWTIVALVAVMKAGGAFVLLDSSQPLPRLQQLCAGVKATLVLSSSANESRSKELADNVIVLSNTMQSPSSCDLHNYGATYRTQPHHAAYASFTSGSTGEPKAVVVEHSAYCSNVLAHSDELQLSKDSRVLQLASYAFGASIVQMVTTLIVGGCVCVPSDSECRDNIAAAVRRLGVNWALFTPSILRVVRNENMSTLKHVILGGEAPARNDITAWPDHVQVIGAYGSAESSVLCAIVPNMRQMSNPQLIGKMTGSVGWVVEPDNHHKLVPLGAIGELLLEGPILARGYLNDEKKSAEAFIEAPSWFPTFCERYNKRPRRGGRMYKTGDLVQYNADGSLNLVGRKDTQVKIRGQRVELGEVEHHVQQSLTGDTSPLLVAEVVTPRGSNHQKLVIYIAIGEAANESPDQVRTALERWTQGVEDRLAERVPQYMVPSAYLAVDTIPMTATGKTDRRRLREMGAGLTLDQLAELQPFRGTIRAPITAMEKQLHELWASVLGIPSDKISADDNFLRIGGDSIAAVQLVAAAREEDLSLTVADVLNTPHLSQMARAVKAESYVEEATVAFSLLQLGIDVNVARVQAAAQCGVDIDLVEDVFPCTPLQEGMLAMTAKRHGDYIIQNLFELRVGIEPERLERAWREVVATMPILRTRVVNLAGQGLVQVVVAGEGSFTACQDLEAYLQADKQEPMGLGGPLTRFAVIDSCTDQRPVLVWTVHHALLDGWSMPLVLKQVEQAYRGRTRDRLVPFHGFIRHVLHSREGTREYWQSQLGGSEAVPFPSLPSPSYQPQADDGLDHQISGLQWPKSGITASTMVRAAWAILQGQYTNGLDVIFGATVTGRQVPVPGVERMAGPTIATVPVRVRWSWETDIRGLLEQVQAQAISMIAYEQMGLQYIRQISPDTELGCRFQTLLVVQPPPREIQKRQRTIEDVLFKAPTKVYENDGRSMGLNIMNSYAIMLECHLGADGMKLRIGFDSRVVEKVQVQRMAWHLEHVLRGMCTEQSGPLALGDVCGVSCEDLRQLAQWNGSIPARVNRCVHELVAEQCRAQPNAPAVCAWDGELTYGELDALSSALAAHLTECGVEPEVFVPLCFEKSRWTTVAMLGVMKAGGAFVLLDPSHPRARMREICQTVSAPLVVSSAANRALAAELAAAVVVVGDEETAWRSQTQACPGSAVTPRNMLYAVFTSGSTGAPKGTVIPHAAFATSAFAHGQAFHLTAESRVLQFSSYAFDASIIESLTTLLIGGCICVPSDISRHDNIAVAANELRVSVAQLTPSTARLLRREDVATLETLVLVGEPVIPSDIDQWGGRVRLVNGYGPAECSAISSVHPTLHAASEAGNIGWAAGCVCWVVDRLDHQRLMPIGAVGELLIEGPIVGCGYLNDPERTAAAFIAPPAWLHQFRAGGSSSESHDSSGSGDRLYKTGDLVQYAADGSLRFVGRKDTQVKLRGQRIELGEVEHHTRLSFPGARDVVAEVVTPAEAGRAPMLVAFVWMDHPIQDDSTGDDEEDDGNEKGRADDILAAPTDGFSAAIPEVETALHDVVPAYMVPAVFLPLRGVPLSATGKTDRRRLRDRAAALSRADIEAYHGSVTAKRSPTTPAECTIQQLWSRVLNLPPAEIGADDHFFRSGGDSIAAMKLAGVAREDGLALTVARVFQHPKLSDLAYSIQSASEVSVNLAPSPFSLLEADDLRDATIQLAIHQCRVSNDQITDIYPCTALQEGLLALTAKSAGAYIAHFSYCLPHDTDLGAFRTAWNAVARANPILNTRIIQHDQWGSFQVVVSADLPWAVYDDGERCSVEAVASFGLGEPLVHTAVIRGKDAHIPPRFILTMHHAVYDAWSLPLLLEQANAALRGNSLVARPFSPFMAYLAESNDAGEAFWRSQFTDLDTTCFPPLPTPTYVPNPTESVTYTITLPQGSTNDFTPATKIRLAWALTLAQYTDTQDVVFGLTVTGRGAPVAGIEQMTGPTIATIPLYVRLDLNATVAQALQRVQDQSTEMLAYEQTGLQKIRHLGAKAAAACQFQNLLVIQPQQDRSATGIFTEPEVRAGKGAFTTYALTLICDLGSDAVTVQATYDPQTIRAIEVQRMLYQLGHITQQISKQPGALIKDMCGVGPEDRRQLLEWNQKVPARVDRCVHALVGERCRTQPDAPAVCAWDGDFTYGELDTLSSSLAAHLVERGMGPEVFVPLYFEKSRWTTVAMLGVMKAGGAFVLLDPSHPRARMREICQTVSAPLVVSSAANRVLAAELAAVVVVVGDNEIPWRQARDACAGSFMVPDNALYAVFTSGSTGAPKGTVIPHAAFATSAFAHGQAFHLTAESRVLQFSSYAFDASIIESLTTLLIGGCVCVPSDTTRRNSIAAAANELRISVAQLTPSTARLLRPGEISTLETLVLIGEPVTSSDIDQWGGRVRLVNGYGPAECSAISSVHPTLLTALDVGNIGWAAGCVCWVVDRTDHEQLVPIGAVGELLIEGPIVGRCYLNDPERTAAAFIAPPAWLRQFRGGGSSGSHDSSGSGDRLYKTGDLVQYAADGSLRFVGRKDTQVKLRGQRIELGEVEHHTRRSFPGARDVVAEVVTPAEAGRAPMLVAFVWMDHPIQDDSTGDDEKDDGNEKNKADDILTAPTDDFRAAIPAAETALHDLVPAYMVPAVFLPLRGVPLSATGKTDRRRLRDRVATLSRADIEAYHGSATGKRSPTTPAECTLQQLWAQVLNLPADEIGADDSFFRLGGDSLTAMQLSAHLRSIGFSLHVSDIFHAKTLARLAPLLTSVHSSSLDYDDREDTPFELSPIQQLFFDLMPNGTDYFNQSFLLPVAQHLTLDVVAYAVDIIVRHHSALRTRFRRAHDGRWVQVVTASIDRSCRCQGTVVASLDEAKDVMRASHRCLNFQNGPILAVDLIEIDSKEQYLFLVAHHLVIDLVSWRVILGDLEELLQNNNLSRARPLPFQTWCRLQAEYSHETLAPAIALPSPGPPAPQGYWGSLDHQNTWGNALSSEFILNEELTAALFGAANNALRTQPVEIFQAALWHSFVHAFPNRTPPTIFNEGHGREPWDPAIDLSRTVGWFTTMWPTWITVNTSASVIDVIRHTKDARRRTPSNGWAYFASRFLNPAGRTVFEIHEPVEIAFNYVGLYQQFEREGAILQPPVRLEDHIPDVGDDVQRFALIDVSTAVERGRLRFSFHYSRHIQHQDAIRQWITHCEQSLEDAVQQLISMEPTHSLCDFPLLSLTYGSLDTLLNQTLPCSGVAPQEVEDIYPCSPMQRGLLLSQAKDTGLYQTRLLWKATPNIRAGSVDIDRLRQAWQQVIARHAILRTIFVDSESEGAGFNQVVRRSSTATTKVIEAFEAEDHSPTVILQRYPRAANRVGQPPHRLLLCATSTETYCALDINHALIDAQSSRILQRDLRLAYDGQLPAEPAPLYSDYMAYLSGFSETNAELYWRSYMDCVQPCLLPIWETDSTRTQLDKKLRSASISLGAGAHLHEFCQRHEVTLSNLFQIAWGLTLQTYTGLDTACFGYLNSGRDVPIAGVQDTVGPFINMLVCRVETDSDISVLSMLQRNQVEYLQGLPHQHCSLAGILHQANVGGRPLFNTVLSLQRPRHSEEGRDAERQCSITLETAGGEDPTEYDITVTIGVGEQDISIFLSYWSTSVGDDRASGIASTLRQIVQEIVGRPHSKVTDLNMMSGDERRQIYAWNRTMPARMNRCVHELVAEQCRAQLDAQAVCAWDGDFTYGEVDALSSSLAAHLVERGVEPEVFVPLCFEKSRWTTVAMLGVMKAGGAFVLLDPSHPRARLQAICQTVSAPLVVSSAANRALAAELAAAVIVVGDNETPWRQAREAWTGSSVAPDNALYAVFTSGSTGAPKGTVIPHAAFATSAFAHGQAFHLTAESRVFQFSSYAFDASILENLTTLLIGGCVCVPSDITRRNNIAAAANELQVSWALLMTSTARLLQPNDVKSLETLAIGGEPVTSRDIERWEGQVELINAYGPTECSAISSVQPKPEAGNIGWAAGCVSWVVDRKDHERLVPIGAVGELLIEGPIVGRCYLNDPERTAAAFIAPPAWLRQFRGGGSSGSHDSSGSGDRLYKTGDLVQYAADGSLRFVGRKDTQVKLRGQRIELGEVEHHTRRSFPGARDVVAEVVTPAEAGRAPMLVAFVWMDHPIQDDSTGDDEKDDGNEKNKADDILTAPTDDFRAAIPAAETALHDLVPAYMVPAVFLPLRGVPLSATGKTDRRRLRDRVATLSRADIGAYQGVVVAKSWPTTPAERTLKQLWSRVLNLPPAEIGPNDHFFRLGGDSIAAMKLASVAREDGIALTVAHVFQHPLLSKQALTISSFPLDLALSLEQAPFSLLGVPSSDAFLNEVYIPQHSWQNQNIVNAFPTTELQAEFVTSHQCSYFHVNIPGPVDPNRLQAACQTLVEQHPILCTVFFPSPKGIIQAIVRCDPPTMVRYTCDSDLLHFSTTLCRDDSRTPLPFGDMPFQASLVSDGLYKHILILRLSHAQYDGLCLPVLYHDLAAAYHGDTIAQAPAFSVCMQYRLSSKSADVSRFWRDFLHGANMTRLDYSSLGGRCTVDTPEITTKVDKKIVLPNLPPGITMASFVKAAWSFVLAQLTRQTDIVFGQTVNGRNGPIPNVDRILGPCVNIVPMRITFQPGWTVIDLLEYTQHQHMQVLPFETSDLRDIVKQSTTWPDLTHFEIIVQHDNFVTDPPFSLGGVECNISAMAFSVPKQFWVHSQQVGDSLQLSVFGPSKLVDSVFAAKILDDICQTILSFTQAPDQSLSLRD